MLHLRWHSDMLSLLHFRRVGGVGAFPGKPWRVREVVGGGTSLWGGGAGFSRFCVLGSWMSITDLELQQAARLELLLCTYVHHYKRQKPKKKSKRGLQDVETPFGGVLLMQSGLVIRQGLTYFCVGVNCCG